MRKPSSPATCSPKRRGPDRPPGKSRKIPRQTPRGRLYRTDRKGSPSCPVRVRRAGAGFRQANGPVPSRLHESLVPVGPARRQKRFLPAGVSPCNGRFRKKRHGLPLPFFPFHPPFSSSGRIDEQARPGSFPAALPPSGLSHKGFMPVLPASRANALFPQRFPRHVNGTSPESARPFPVPAEKPAKSGKTVCHAAAKAFSCLCPPFCALSKPAETAAVS